MNPENSKARLNSLLIFTALFLLTLICAIAAIFFDFTLPKEQAKRYKDENERLKVANQQYNSSFILLDSIRNNITRFDEDTNPVKQNQLEQQINSCLIVLTQAAAQNDSSINTKIASRAADAYQQVLIDKRRIAESKGSSAVIEDYKAQLKQVKDDLKQAQKDLTECSVSLKVCTGAH